MRQIWSDERKYQIWLDIEVLACEAMAELAAAVPVPVIASGGAGTPEHFFDAFQWAGASGALAATIFHDRIISIPHLKEELARCGIEMRR